MVSRDVEQTLGLRAIARELTVGLKLDCEEVFATKPHRTLLLHFVNVVSGMSTALFANTFPLLSREICENHGNNPMAYDWGTLAIAVDNLHGHYVYGSPLNTP